MTRARSWTKYGHRVGYRSRAEYVGSDPRENLGIIALEPIRQLNRPVTLGDLRANGISFPPQVQQGRGLEGAEAATVLRLAGGYT